MATATMDNTTHPVVNSEKLIADLTGDSLYQQITGVACTPVMVWGQPGVGKSDVARQVGKKTGRPVIDIRLLLKDPTDLGGLPYFCPETNMMRYAQPSELPNKDGPFANAIILLDELSSAPAAVQAAALQLVLERRVGEYELPEGVMIMAAGNRSNDGTVHASMPQPLRNRFRHYTMVVDSESWLNWAREYSVDTAVQSFIKGNPDDLNRFDAKNKHAYAYATPRTWKFVSDEIKKVKMLRSKGHNVSDADLFRRIATLVGEDVRLKFKAHYDDAMALPDPFDVVRGKVKEFKIAKPSMKYGCSLNVMYALREIINNRKAENAEGGEEFTDKEYVEYVDNAIRFLVKNIDEKDIMISAIWMATDKEYDIDLHDAPIIEELIDDPEFDNFFAAM